MCPDYSRYGGTFRRQDRLPWGVRRVTGEYIRERATFFRITIGRADCLATLLKVRHIAAEPGSHMRGGAGIQCVSACHAFITSMVRAASRIPGRQLKGLSPGGAILAAKQRSFCRLENPISPSRGKPKAISPISLISPRKNMTYKTHEPYKPYEPNKPYDPYGE